MGIYPEVSYEVQPERPLSGGRRRKARMIRKISEPGLEVTEVYVLQTVKVNRTDCYCCTCDHEGMGLGWPMVDAACRNHGYAGRRPCEIHGMPGDSWDNEMIGREPDAELIMPTGVEEYRRNGYREKVGG